MTQRFLHGYCFHIFLIVLIASCFLFSLAPVTRAEDPYLKKLELSPNPVMMKKLGDQVDLQAIVTLQDGSTRDVTDGVIWDIPQGQQVVSFEEPGHLEAKNDGKISIKARYFGLEATVDVQVDTESTQSADEWDKLYTAGSFTEGSYAEQTMDGGYIVSGTTFSNYVPQDAIVLKTNEKGFLEWKQTFGGEFDDKAREIKQTEDGGYIFVGKSEDEDGSSVWVIKLKSSGKVEWEKKFRNQVINDGFAISQTKDGGYIVTGMTIKPGPNWGKEPNDPETIVKVYLLKLKANGKLQWEKTFEKNSRAFGSSVQQTTDGGYVIIGSASYNNDYSPYLIKLNAKGAVEWDKVIESTIDDYGYYGQQTTDGGYIIMGDKTIDKLDAQGDVVWNKDYSDDYGFNHFISVQQTNDGGYILAREDRKTEGFQTGLLKLNSTGSEEWSKSFGKENTDYYPYSVRQTADNGFIVTGQATKMDDFDFDAYLYLLKVKGTGEQNPTQIKLSKKSISLKVGSTSNVKATAVYANGSKKDITSKAEWKSSDPAVVTVKQGKIVAIGQGKATITASYGDKTITAQVTVSPKNPATSSIAE